MEDAARPDWLEGELLEIWNKLTLLQRRWVKEYLVNPRPTAAARAAGYSHKRANAAGYKNAHNPKIRKILDAWQKAEGMATDEARRINARIARGSMADFLVIPEGGERVISLEEAADIDLLGRVQKITKDEDGNVELELANEPYLSLAKAAKAGVLDLMESYRVTREGTVMVKLYSKADALDKEFKIGGVYSEKHDVTVTAVKIVQVETNLDEGDV